MAGTQSVIHQFAEGTSLHGIPHIVKSRSTSIKLLWLTVFLASLGVFGYYSYNIIRRYVSHDTSISIEIKNEAVPMPEITICNKQGISDTVKLTLINKMLPYWSTNSPSVPATSLLDNVTQELYQYMTSVIPLSFSKNMNLQFFDRNRVTSTLRPENVMALAPSINMTLISCLYQNKECQLQITENFNSAFFKCFSLRILLNNHRLNISSLGPQNGVVLNLFGGMNPTPSDFPQIQEDSRLDRFIQKFPGIYDKQDPESGTEGFKLVVHPVGHTVFPQQDALSISTSTLTNLAIKYSKMSRLGQPYGECNKASMYTVQACKTQCLKLRIKEICKCTDLSLLTTTSKKTVAELECPACYNYTTAVSRACNKTRDGRYPLARFLCDDEILTLQLSKVDDCANQISAGHADNCHCPPPCLEHIYSTQQYSTPLGSVITDQIIALISTIKSQQPELLQLLKSRMPNTSSLNSHRDVAPYLVNHMALVNLYMADTNVVTVAESPAYSEAEMVADIGGMLGLSIGVSFITVIELIELTVQLCTRRCKRIVHPQNGNSTATIEVTQKA